MELGTPEEVFFFEVAKKEAKKNSKKLTLFSISFSFSLNSK